MEKGKGGRVFISETCIKGMAEEVFTKYWVNPQIIVLEKNNIINHIKNINTAYLNFTYNRINGLDAKALQKAVFDILSENRHLNSLIWSMVYFDDEFLHYLLKKVSSNISQQRVQEIWVKATVPAFESFEQQRNSEILKMISRGTGWLNIVEKCQYFFANYDQVVNIEETEKKLYKQYKNISRIQAKRLMAESSLRCNGKILNYEKQIQSFLKNKEEWKLTIYLQEIMKLRDARKNAVSKVLTIVYRVAQKMFQIAGVDETLIPFCSSYEISKGIGYLIRNKKFIEKRPNGIAMLFTMNSDMKPEFEYGTFKQTMEKLESYYRKQNLSKLNSSKEIKGNIAYPGNVRGRVKLVVSSHDFREFKKDNILVTGMTRPEFVPLIKQARAIITDEGGITCHAAIISREFGIPCIIGTKIATQVLKDGDLVEVDAEQGIVRILKKVK